MPSRPTVGPSALLGLALAGVLAGHSLTYRVLMPDAHERTAELARNGHGYLDGANALGLVAVIAALAIVFLGRLVRPNGTERHVLRRLTAFQLTAFAAMELLERLGSGAGMHQLPRVFVVGVPAQLLVAAIVAAVVRLTLQAATIVADRGVGGAAVGAIGAIAATLRPVVVPPLPPTTGAPLERAPPFAG
ncbi:MAG: hypothetical protein ABJB55_07545 [Actinomycetota bacterium]